MDKLLVDSPGQFLASYFYKPSETARLLVISGNSGVGKTHWCSDLYNQAKERGLDVKGLISIPVFKNNRKIAINLQNLENGSTYPLASRSDVRNGEETVGDWLFNEDTLEMGNVILEQIQSCQVLIIDELGPMEFNSHQGLNNAFELIQSGNFDLACVVVRPALISKAQAIWPSAEVFYVPNGSEKQ